MSELHWSSDVADILDGRDFNDELRVSNLVSGDSLQPLSLSFRRVLDSVKGRSHDDDVSQRRRGVSSYDAF